ncbi:hypothetical protein [Marinibacterium sp. SX1]|uniref:hypothetical protein n=1 Tax=Marinibacterium sp. SX1 TaxID=3388424 RepID=UPI003D16D219
MSGDGGGKFAEFLAAALVAPVVTIFVTALGDRTSISGRQKELDDLHRKYDLLNALRQSATVTDSNKFKVEEHISILESQILEHFEVNRQILFPDVQIGENIFTQWEKLSTFRRVFLPPRGSGLWGVLFISIHRMGVFVAAGVAMAVVAEVISNPDQVTSGEIVSGFFITIMTLLLWSAMSFIARKLYTKRFHLLREHRDGLVKKAREEIEREVLSQKRH